MMFDFCRDSFGASSIWEMIFARIETMNAVAGLYGGREVPEEMDLSR